MPEIDGLLQAYIQQVKETIRRLPGLNDDESRFTVERLVQKLRKNKYPREVTYQIVALIVTHGGYQLLITQTDVATRRAPFLISRCLYQCFDRDGGPIWWLETTPHSPVRHFQKREHDHIDIRDVDVRKFTSIDMLEVFRRFCDDGTTLDQLREAELNEKSWERFPQE